MSKPERIIAANHHQERTSSYGSYVVGFVLSVVLTLGSYMAVTRHILAGNAGFVFIAGLALLQFTVQLLCFLHVGGETKPRWKLMVFWSMILAVLIIVAGSIWIMNNLSYNMMPPTELKTYMHSNEGL